MQYPENDLHRMMIIVYPVRGRKLSEASFSVTFME
jgi:hypothetical protein